MILEKVELLQHTPILSNTKRLTNRHDYRIRERDYRIIYDYDKENLYVIIIDKRGQVYR